ncbi:nucleoside deaminase [Achromobacter sp. RTa]|uniref:nucleoside deaminase n=1 Tax=Achromobacter sp. RTa TaxID=1532557 RepID=UPI000AE99F5C|nr:nucleoside deaminase [Achromobacter sp. RTa]
MPVEDSRLIDDALMREAVALARDNMRDGGRPFGAVLAFEGRVVARGVNEILASHDPTAHAELQAIRHASRALGRPRLDGCVVYASGHPCPMCMAAMHMCGISRAFYAYSNEDGEPYGLSTAAVYAQMALPPEGQSLPLRALRPDGEDGLYAEWKAAARP